MSLGVLNNLSAMYAENNLNNTSNSLNTVLQQLSSGSKINSGADDAAGLSLVDGLQANSMALAQSQTNASEGVGLLKVADGALSQVTNLLNRAVTLATEASNGTLNNSQDAAANSEYQSILSEINNIGATTTYNGQTVFGAAQPVSIYTGDSSTAGASVDALNIASLSSSNVGDTGGVMAYSNGSNNVFLNLSSSTANAAATDYLNGGSGGTTNLNVTYAVPGGTGSNTTATTSISVGAGSNYANTSNGLISAINNAGLGLTASFATQTQAGVQGGGSQTGIEISGGLISAGVDPSTSSTSGTLNLSGLAAGATLAQGSTLTITDGSTTYAAIQIGSSNNTLQTLAIAIGANTSSAVTASVITNGDGTQSLQLSDIAGGGALSVATNGGTAQIPSFTGASLGVGTAGATQAVQTSNSTTGTATVVGAASILTINDSGTDSASTQLTLGSKFTITNTINADTQIQTFVVGTGTDVTGATGTHFTANVNAGGTTLDSLGQLADTINAQSSTLGVYATVGSTGLTLTTGIWTSGTYEGPSATGTIVGSATKQAGQDVSISANTLTTSTSGAGGSTLQVYAPQVGGASAGTVSITSLGDNSGTAAHGDSLTGIVTIQGAGGTAVINLANINGGVNNYDTLATAITNSGIDVSAAWDATANGVGKGGLTLTSTADGLNSITVTPGSLRDTTDGGGTNVTTVGGGTTDVAGTNGNPVSTPSTAILQLDQSLGTNNINDANNGSVLGGTISLTYNTHSDVFIMGSDPGALSGNHVAGAIYTNGTDVASLVSAINDDNHLGLSATTGTGGTGAIYLQGAAGVASAITMNTVTPSNTATALGVVTSLGATTGTGSVSTTAVTGIAAIDNVTAGGATIATSDTVSGSVTVVNTGTATSVGADVTGGSVYAAGSGSTKTVSVLDTGAANTEANQVAGSIKIAVGGNNFTYTAAAGDTWQQAITAINGSAIAGSSSNTGGVTAQWNANAGGAGIGGITLTSYANGASAVVVSNNNLKSSVADTFVVGTAANSPTTNTYYTNANGSTLTGLAATIQAVSGLNVNVLATSSGLSITQATDNGGSVTVASSANSLTDVTAGSYSNITSSPIASNNDTLSGALVFNVGAGGNQTVTMANVVTGGQPATAQGMVNYIHANSTALGVDAQWVPNTSGNLSFGTIKLTSNTEGSTGTVNISTALTSLTDTTVNPTLSYTAGAAYSTGLSNGTNAVLDFTTGQTAATFTAQNLKGSGIATISYSDQAGQSLSTSDLTNSTDAKSALTALNAAITDVASQDGYIGAQINTLNSVSSVLSTQQQNVTAAQNAVQATDYASAASNMSKYEILSQTGISALAQANSMQQEVTKLLQ
jgi:flagellin